MKPITYRFIAVPSGSDEAMINTTLTANSDEEKQAFDILATWMSTIYQEGPVSVPPLKTASTYHAPQAAHILVYLREQP
jgi:hypothetical protein